MAEEPWSLPLLGLPYLPPLCPPATQEHLPHTLSPPSPHSCAAQCLPCLRQWGSAVLPISATGNGSMLTAASQLCPCPRAGTPPSPPRKVLLPAFPPLRTALVPAEFSWRRNGAVQTSACAVGPLLPLVAQHLRC